KFLSKVATDYTQNEPSLVRLKDGTLVIISRPEGTIVWSSDDAKTWTDPVTFGIRMFAPTLLVLKDGTLLCHYGSYNHGGLRAIFSTDAGHTWVAAAKNRGFLVDRTYGYSRSCLMPDGSAYLAYIGTGGHRGKDRGNNMIWSIRLRVRDDHSGIELLPTDPNAAGETSRKMPDPGKPVPGV
ncbi:MAG: sialidase family protein, partial [Planctomycetota bacterium]|nr:sialidase family protein [Planctomycetota bacterium]